MQATDKHSVRPNILWYCTDQQRYDTIHALGNPHIRTPTLDRLAAMGTAFTRCYVQSQICTPSRASFLTGRYPASHHVHRNGNDYFPAQETLVTKLLAGAGYDCGLIGKLHLSRAKGHEERSDDGYRVFHWSHHPMPDLDPQFHAYYRWLVDEKKVDPHELYAPLQGFLTPGVPAELHQTTWCSEMAIRFIAEQREPSQPWCLSINPFDPHPPFDPPPEYLSRYDPETLPQPLFRDGDIERQRAFQDIAQQSLEAVDPRYPVDRSETVAAQGSSTAYTPPPRFYGREVIAAYYAMIELIDDQLARILDVLEDSGQLHDTLIIFSSDHGELLGDHGLLYKGCRFFEGLVHVPLIIAWAGELKAGLVSDALVESIDIAPTLLQAAGIDTPYYMQGRSLLELLRGQADVHHHKPHVVTEFNDALGSARLARASHATMVFDGRYKSVIYHDKGLGELFDLQQDPGEFDNLWPQREASELKYACMERHINAVMATSSAGVARTSIY